MEKPLRYTFVSDLSETHHFTSPEAFKKEHLVKHHPRIPFYGLEILPEHLSSDGSKYLHLVEASQKKINESTRDICLRVITNKGYGMNVHIHCYTNEMYSKYLDIRHQVRNRDKVLITFPKLRIKQSGFRGELMAIAYDFKMLNPDDDIELAFDI